MVSMLFSIIFCTLFQSGYEHGIHVIFNYFCTLFQSGYVLSTCSYYPNSLSSVEMPEKMLFQTMTWLAQFAASFVAPWYAYLSTQSQVCDSLFFVHDSRECLYEIVMFSQRTCIYIYIYIYITYILPCTLWCK